MTAPECRAVCLCCCRYLRFKPTAAGAVTWVSPSLQSIDAFTGNLMAGEGPRHRSRGQQQSRHPASA
jgi:hypothetical protein